jgi:antitoxin component YwqK of YwqJK toxin-antitoxin module
MYRGAERTDRSRATIRLGLAVAVCAVAALGCSSNKDAQKTDGKATGGDADKGAENIKSKVQGDEKVIEFDLNGDKKPDVWAFTVPAKTPEGKDFERLARKELDLNWDGKVDVARWYDEKEQIVKEGLDLDFDGKIDQLNFYEKGVVVRKESDLSSAGKPSLWKFYEKGKLVRKERDTNGDGKVDYWEYWEGDQVDRVGEDLDGDGNVDKWTKNPNSES